MTDGIDQIVEVWKKQPRQDGFVFLCTQDPITKGWKEHPLKLDDPELEGKARKLVTVSVNLNVYWSMMTFSGPNRKKELAQETRFAPLDGDEGRAAEFMPSRRWATSPGRWSGAYEIAESMKAEDASYMGRAIAWEIGADKGGWDITQVLRVPGTLNHKYPDKPVVGPMVVATAAVVTSDRARKLSAQGREIDAAVADLGDLAKEPIVLPANSTVLVELKAGVQFAERDRKAKTMLSTVSVKGADRSKGLFYLEHALARAGVSFDDACVIIKASAWNKFKDRRNQDHWIRVDVRKAYRHVEAEESGELKAANREPRPRQGQIWADDLLMQEDKGADWLVEEFYPDKAGGMGAGEPKAFKSTIGATDLGVSVATGTRFLGRYRVLKPGLVVLLDGENSLNTIRRRIVRVLASRGLTGDIKIVEGKIMVEFGKAPAILIVPKGSTPMMGTDEGMRRLDEIVGDLKPRMIIADPLYKMFDGDINTPKDAARLTQWLTEAQVRHDCALFVIHHYRKGDGDGGQRMMGSAYLHAWLQVGLYFTKQDPGSGEEGKPVRVAIEREFRDEETPEKIDVTLRMGEDEDGQPYYEATVGEHQGKKQDGEKVSAKVKTAMKVMEVVLKSGPAGSQRKLFKQCGEYVAVHMQDVADESKPGETAFRDALPLLRKKVEITEGEKGQKQEIKWVGEVKA